MITVLVRVMLVFFARFCTMLVMILRRTDVASDKFTYGYTVIAQKSSYKTLTLAPRVRAEIDREAHYRPGRSLNSAPLQPRKPHFVNDFRERT